MISVNKNWGYFSIRAPVWYPGKLFGKGYCQLHVFIYWFYYRILPKAKEEIHHIDLNPRNNKIANLQLLSTKDHRKIHGEINRKFIPYYEIKCANCSSIFTRSLQRYNKGKIAFCSKACLYKAMSNKNNKVNIKQHVKLVRPKVKRHKRSKKSRLELDQDIIDLFNHYIHQ